MSLNIETIRNQFPILKEKVHGKPLVYFDNAATTQKPVQVTQALTDAYNTINSNIHRGAHYLSHKATQAYEDARKNIQQYINAAHEYEVIFTRGTTESINLVAASYCREFCSKGDEIIVSGMEHHSNIVPWQLACEQYGLTLKVIPFTDKGDLILSELEQLISDKTKLISLAHISNTLGTVNPIQKVIELAHAKVIPVLVDAAQSIAHYPIDVIDLDVDFLVFSAHKMYGPTGIGALYGKEKWLNKMPPYQGGGEMIKTVSFEKTTFNDLPYKFEAGTPDYIAAIGFSAAVDYIKSVGLMEIKAYEDNLLAYATAQLSLIDGLKIYGESDHKSSLISFLVDGVHPFDAGTLLDQLGIAIRTGNHCAQPVMERFGITGTMRASFAFYNSKEEVDIFVAALKRIIAMLKMD